MTYINIALKENPALRQGKRQPHPEDILTIHLRIPRKYYDSLSRFAAYLAKTPMLNQETGDVELDEKGQVKMSMQAPDIQTYLLTCGIRTQEAFVFVQQMQARQMQARQMQAQQQQQQQLPPR
jgi:hypothetical protein